jgi:hypothetical protein
MTAVADLRPSWSSRQVRPSAWLPRSFSWRKLTPRWRSILRPSVQFRCSSRFSFFGSPGRDFGVPAVLSTHRSGAARWEADAALFVAEIRAKVLRLNAPTHQSARLRSREVGHRGNRAQRGFAKFGRFAPRRLSLGPQCGGKSCAHARISLNSLECPIIERLVGGERGIRTLGTGYPVRQISNAVSVWEKLVSNKTL